MNLRRLIARSFSIAAVAGLVTNSQALAQCPSNTPGGEPDPFCGLTIIPGNTLVATGNDVFVRFLGGAAGFTNDLYLYAFVSGQNLNGAGQFLFTNHPGVSDPSPGDVITLTGFTPGDEVIFAIYVTEFNGTNRVYYTGPGSRNPDGLVHVRFAATGNPDYPTLVGFEDLLGGGDQDYNDLYFDVRGVSVVPEPFTIVLLGSGLFGVGSARMIRRRRGKETVS